MTDQLVPDGRYTVVGAGALAMKDAVVLIDPNEDDARQQWDVYYDAGVYTFRNVATGVYLGDDNDPDEVLLDLFGTAKPYPWRLTPSTQEPGEYVLASAASTSGLVLTRGFKRVHPPRAALMDPDTHSSSWSLNPVT
ncbi:RICIN domain-containing protein [Spirillospora sp. NPDC048911]|uniref:RICIN domain-containing protein n=1 Tax=Spirillospora sp. NPDC048911 TaxID=3364527 RepID=UPI003723BC6F